MVSIHGILVKGELYAIKKTHISQKVTASLLKVTASHKEQTSP